MSKLLKNLWHFIWWVFSEAGRELKVLEIFLNFNVLSKYQIPIKYYSSIVSQGKNVGLDELSLSFRAFPHSG